MQNLTHIDMFSGAGLFSAGFVDVGFEPRLAIDLSKEAVATYNRNLPAVAVAGSVTTFDQIPAADVLIAGPPCQGFSTLGRQDPLDVRNGLALEVPRWAQASDASVVVVENVPPFLNSAHWSELAAALEELGYGISTWVLDAAEHGAPQVRRRAFTIASKIGPIARPLPSPERISAGAAIGAPMQVGDPLHTWPTPKGIAAERIALIPPKGDKRDVMRLAPHLCPPSWEKVGIQATDVWGRINPELPANTIRCTFQNPSKGRYLHPTENRTLSLREGARLQGVPDSWTFVGRPYPVARQIGNGVPVPLARAVAASVREALLAVRSEIAA
ncbi:MAG: DNA cytosine methyltransferase [Sphingomonadales bacterium]|nr:DNA cytosine methyltransferase [Sphingomonadales bacterium]MDE2171555.1 DNA cytosine methyltransferase [Sphingomonadales bacterium]